MTTRHWTVDPRTIIAHRAGRFSLGRLSGTMPTVPIVPADIVLLAQFLEPSSLDAGVDAFVSEPMARFLPGRPDRKAVDRRLMQFRQGGILVRSAGDDRPGESEVLDVEMCLTDGEGERCAYRLTRNFLLQPHPHGFETYSARTGRHYCFDLELSLMLLGFADGCLVDALAAALPGREPAEVARVAAWFYEQGLLRRAEDHNPAAAGDYRKSVPIRRATASDWRDIEPDGRIPVYFVPHMENHFPLALGMIYSALAHWSDGDLLDHYQLVPISYLKPGELLRGPYRKFGRGVWLFSNYMWSIDLNLKVSDAVKRDDPGNLTIHGGPSTPSYEQACDDFMARHTSVDIAVHGEGEITTCRILECVERDDDIARLRPTPALSEVEGLAYRDPESDAGELIRTGPRLRMSEPDFIPSPYSEGVFDAYEARVEAAIVETNRGCPFKCTFCDWGSATNQKVSKFDLDRIREELDWIGRNRIGVLWIADANFGMLKRDLEIARWIVETREEYGYPEEVVVNYTKNANERLAEIIRVFTEGGIISQGIISIQTTDEKTLEIIDRKNIKTEKYDQLIDIFSELGLPLSTDLMIGLPGITPEAFDRDLQRYIDVDVSVKAYPTQLLPNSPMAHPAYMKKYDIRVDDNDFLISCSSYSEKELDEMKLTYHVYTVADGYGVLRHVLRYLQWEHGIQAIRVIHDLIDLVRRDPERYPAVTWVIRFFANEKCMPGGWRPFFDQISDFVAQRYGIERDAAFEVVLEVNELMMPDEARDYPLTVSLNHDYVAWFTEHNRRDSGPVRHLGEYPSGEITVSDPNNMARINFEYQQYDTHQFFWELHSPVSRAKSIADAANSEEQSSLAATP